MAGPIDQRNKQNIRRVLYIVLIIMLLAAYPLYMNLRREPLPQVRTAAVTRGDISSRMYVTAEINPGRAAEHKLVQQQRVLGIHVGIGDQVEAGDVLLTLDLQELQEQYDAAKQVRKDIERSLAEADEAARAQADAAQAQIDAAEKAAGELERQVNRLSSSLAGAVALFGRLAATQPATLEVEQDIDQLVNQFVENLDPENPEPQIQVLILQLSQSFQLSENPAYLEALDKLEQELQTAAASASQVLGGLAGSSLAGNFTLPLDISDQFGSLAGLTSAVQDPLIQAIAYEEAAREQLEQAVPELTAKISGIVAAVNVEVGELTGPVQPQITTGLEGLIGGSLGSVTGSTQSAVIIYDNIQPIAVFQSGRLDSMRLKEGMPVQYRYETLTFSGEITEMGRFAGSQAFSEADNLDIFSDFPAAGGFTAEPKLPVTMSIRGMNLPDLVMGFWIDAEIETASAVQVLMLPAEAMRREVNDYFVYLVSEDGQLHQQMFQPGIQSEMFVEVLSGLEEGDRVVLNPAADHMDGLIVQEIIDE